LLFGNGLIASIFDEYRDKQDYVVFASGVSNSNELREEEFFREEVLVKKILNNYKTKQFIYFSSCSLEDVDLKGSPYHQHKLNMEKIIENLSNNYIIFRLPHVVGKGGNKNTVINYFYNKVENEEYFDIWENATRNIIDMEFLYKVVSYLIDNKVYLNEKINIAYENNTKVVDIVIAIERILNKKANYTLIEKGSDLKINMSKIRNIIKEIGMEQPTIFDLIKNYKE